MRVSVALQIAVVLAGLVPLAVRAASDLPRFNVPASRLSGALTTLARQAGIEILFSDTVVGDRDSPALRGRMSVDAALETLLAGSGLAFRRTGDGTIVVNLSTAAARTAPAASEVEAAIPEILVVGRRAQNGDIRRTQGDIQPYQVFTRREIEDSHAGSIDNFTRTRLPANAQTISPAQNVRGGQSSNRSEINLRGLGANQTLLLVDGRRLPGIPQVDVDTLQPDVNGFPIELIERIEVLTATAGGIYGIGATSGVLNVVLKHDYAGGEVALTTGITTRGDNFEHRIFGRFGFSPDHGRTGIMVAVGETRADALHSGDRDYVRRARERVLVNNPDILLGTYPLGNGINIFATTDLVLDESQGGTALGAGRTFIPRGLDGDTATRNQLFLANAGQTQLDPGSGTTITSRPEIRSIFADVRHDFGGDIVGFANILSNRNIGRSSLGSQSSFFGNLPASSPLNPFQQDIGIATALPGSVSNLTTRITTMRYTIGLVAPLPSRWKANLEYNGGKGTSRYTTRSRQATSELYDTIFNGPLPGRPAIDPLGNWADYIAAASSYTEAVSARAPRTTKFDDATLRVAGPIAALPGGPLTLTLLGEARREVSKKSVTTDSFIGVQYQRNYPRNAVSVLSVYGEARVPLVGDHGFFRGLEFQLAARQDWVRTSLPAEPPRRGDPPVLFVSRTDSLAYTAGARFSPLPGILLRASAGTGSLPPSPSQIIQATIVGDDFRRDPKRGDRQIGSEAPVTFLYGGNPKLRPERARSYLVGVVATPAGDLGPRLSIDYTRIIKRGEIQVFPLGDVDALLASEALYPSRVVRGPLTPADAAQGFTAGPIKTLDFGLLNLGRTRIDAVDFTVDYPFVTRFGRFNAYLKATWEPNYRQQAVRGAPVIERVGYSDGPLEWRGNAGVDWSNGPWSVGANAQYFNHYRITSAYIETIDNSELVANNGRVRIPAQVYVDLSCRYRFDGTGFVPRGTEIRAGIVNLFDHRPPIIADLYSSGISYYGDARRQRVELTLSVPLGKN